MSDRTRVSTPKSVKKQQQRARRDKRADAAIMAGLEQEREMIRLQKDATKSANLARARRAQEVTQVGPPVAQPNFDDTGMQTGLPFDESSIRQSPSDPSTPNNYEAPPPFPLTPSRKCANWPRNRRYAATSSAWRRLLGIFSADRL